MLTGILRLADRLSRSVGFEPRLDADALLGEAVRRHQLDPAAEPGLAEGLAAELAALDAEAGLSLFGRLAASWDIARLLASLARLQAAERADPAILRRPVAAPIVITGLPRSGTTFLHRLLAEDAANLVPRCWQTIYPYPPRHRRDTEPRRRARVEREFKAFARLAPELPAMYPLFADTPQECTEITAHVFQSMRFDTTHRVPSYRAWLDARGHLDAYRFHRRFLQHLQGPAPAPGRWMLKCPDHVFALPALLQVYPDARLVFVHRDPLKVLASVARLTEIIRAPFARAIDRAEIGRQVADRWVLGAEILAQAEALPAGRVAHLHYRALVADPAGTVAATYRRFGLALEPAAAARMRAFAQRERDSGAGRTSYRLADYALDPALLRERFGAYMRHFDVPAESVSAIATPPIPGILVPVTP